MLIDTVQIWIKAGNGGNGAATLLHDAQKAHGGPDGGNGGNGGNVYFQGTNNLIDLSDFRHKKIIAEDGIKGRNQKRHGKNAPHLTILLPLGTRITDLKTYKIIEIVDSTPLLICHGGKGGLGNAELKSALDQTPLTAEAGTPGEEKNLLLELRMIADIGLIGLPNAGKSSLLSCLTNATPKIGDYPFTTLEPNIGMMDKYTVADIPGLIEGASLGKGLGTQFLKHIEKTKILVHCIDISHQDLFRDYEIIRQEFRHHDADLLDKTELVVLNKSDLLSKEESEIKSKDFMKKFPQTIVCSIFEPKTIVELKKKIIELLTKENKTE